MSSTTQEFEKCSDPDTGYLHFLQNYYHFEHPMLGSHLQFNPYWYQIDMVKTYHKNNKVLSLVARQNGKSLTAAGYLLWYALFNPNSHILIIGHNHTNSLELLNKIKYGYSACPPYVYQNIGTVNNTNNTIEFENGSRITINQEITKYTLVYCDEFAFNPNGEVLLNTIIPLAKKVIITSSVNSNTDAFFKLWRMSQFNMNFYVRFNSTWKDNPSLNHEWAQQQIEKLGKERFDKEYNCIFPIEKNTEQTSTEFKKWSNAAKEYLETEPMRKIIIENRFNFDTNDTDTYIKCKTKTGIQEIPVTHNIISQNDYSIEDICKMYNTNITLISNGMEPLTQEEQEFLINPKQWCNNKADEEINKLKHNINAVLDPHRELQDTTPHGE